MRFPLTFLLLTSLCLPLVAQQATQLGDFDNDGIATVRDIALIAGYFGGTATLTDAQKQMADVNRDGAVNATDMDEIVKKFRRNPEVLAESPPPPTSTAPHARDRNTTHSSRTPPNSSFTKTRTAASVWTCASKARPSGSPGNLDAIISVGYRVKSRVATQFRIWATRHLREYIVKGFVLDDERLKNPDLPFDYFGGGGTSLSPLFSYLPRLAPKIPTTIVAPVPRRHRHPTKKATLAPGKTKT